MAVVTYTSVFFLSLILILSVSHACDPFNSKQFKEECDKTPHPEYCLRLVKARIDDSMSYHIYSPQDMAQYLMCLAAGIGHELTALARAEGDRLPKGSAQQRCMEKCAAGFDAAASKLDIVDGKLLENRRETFDLVYRFVQSKAGALAQDWNACPGRPATGVMVSKQKQFAMLMDIVLALGKLPDGGCASSQFSIGL
ncbi:unnamed protein product [Alopecurus aequalis]